MSRLKRKVVIRFTCRPLPRILERAAILAIPILMTLPNNYDPPPSDIIG